MIKSSKKISISMPTVKNQKTIKKKLNKRQRQIKKKKAFKQLNVKGEKLEYVSLNDKESIESTPYKDEQRSLMNPIPSQSPATHTSKKRNRTPSPPPPPPPPPPPSKSENRRKVFKAENKIQNSDEYSANWKKLKDMLESKHKDCRPRPTPNLAPPMKTSNAETKLNKKEEIWFEVDPILLKNTRTSETDHINFLHQNKISNNAEEQLKAQSSYAGVTRAVALDCEMVGGGISGEEDILARVSIVNHFGNALYDKYVKPTEPVKDYRTKVSGIRPKDLVKGESFSTVQKEVNELISGRIVVGHALSNDFACLLLSHPKYLIRDTSKFKQFIKLIGGGTPSLKKLSEKVLGIQIQSGEHCSVQDAQAAMKLYTLNRKEWEQIAQKKRKILKKKMKKSSDAKSSDENKDHES